MPHIFERVSSNPKHDGVNTKLSSSREEPLIGTHKISYRSGEDWDFEGFTESAPIDLSLAMPPHRPKAQPEGHRSSMFLSSESGPIRVKVCRHCLNRPFQLEVAGGTSDVTVWVPSNFKGFITYAGSASSKVSFSEAFVEGVLPNAYVNHNVPKAWCGDQLIVSTRGSIAFRVWDVFSKKAEVVQKRDVWRRVFGGGQRTSPSPPPTPTWNWDFLIEDDD